MLVLEWKKRAFIEKLTSKCFCWFPAAILVHQSGTKIWRLYTKFYKGVWNVSANNSATVRHKDLRLGQIVYINSLLTADSTVSAFWASSVQCWCLGWRLSLKSHPKCPTFHFLGFFHWTVLNLFFCCVTVTTIYSLRVNKKNILGEYCSFFKPRTWNYPHLDCINLYRNGR